MGQSRKSRSWRKVLVVVMLIVAAGVSAYLAFAHPTPPKVPAGADIVVVVASPATTYTTTVQGATSVMQGNMVVRFRVGTPTAITSNNLFKSSLLIICATILIAFFFVYVVRRIE